MKNNYTSNIYKLAYKTDRVEEFKNNLFRPIGLHFALTDKCNLNCEFCSNENRESNEFTLDEVKNTLKTFSEIGAKAVEFTGGEPTLHPNINEIVSYAKEIGFSIGIKSNGVNIHKSLKVDTIKKTGWIRISLNCLDYINQQKLNFKDIIKNTVFSFSYVIHDHSPKDILDTLMNFKKKYQNIFLRIIPDNSFSSNKINNIYSGIKSHDIFKDSTVFWHNKNYDIPEKCWMMYIKPFINTDKNVYFCCATQMFERKFIKKYKLCSIEREDIINAWSKQFPRNGKMCEGGICYFKEQNDFINAMVEGFENEEFI